jgi:AcrR family transcriptional regulator
VSPGLVRHHFGAKEALREAVDTHVLAEIHRINKEAKAGSRRGDLAVSAMSRQAVRPYQRYLVRALMDGSPSVATFFDNMVGPTEEWLALADERRADEPLADSGTRAAVLTAMALGVPLLHEHLSRVLGVDIFSSEGDRRLSLALLDLYSHALITPELAASAQAGLDNPEERST